MIPNTEDMAMTCEHAYIYTHHSGYTILQTHEILPVLYKADIHALPFFLL